MLNEVLEDSDGPLLSPAGVEDSAISEPLSPVDNSGYDVDDETNERISDNQSRSEVYKPLPSVESSSSGWIEDLYEKSSMVCFTHSVLLVQGLYSYTHPTSSDYGKVFRIQLGGNIFITSSTSAKQQPGSTPLARFIYVKIAFSWPLAHQV